MFGVNARPPVYVVMPLICQPPIAQSTGLERFAPYFRPLPNGMSQFSAIVTSCLLKLSGKP